MQTLSALLVSSDDLTIGISNRVLHEYSFDVKTATTASTASELMRSSRFDLALYDLQIPGAIDLASPTSPGSPGVVFAILDGCKSASILGKRIHFSLQKPLSADLVARTVRAAHSVMLWEKRTAIRHQVHIPTISTALMQGSEARELKEATILNLSHNGLCLEVHDVLPQSALLEIKFQLPGSKDSVQVTGAVMWTHTSGKAGLKFVRIAAQERQKLQAWLDSKLPPELGSMAGASPEPVSVN